MNGIELRLEILLLLPADPVFVADTAAIAAQHRVDDGLRNRDPASTLFEPKRLWRKNIEMNIAVADMALRVRAED